MYWTQAFQWLALTSAGVDLGSIIKVGMELLDQMRYSQIRYKNSLQPS